MVKTVKIIREEKLRISTKEAKALMDDFDSMVSAIPSASENDAKLSGYSDWSGEIDADGHRVNE